MSQVAETTSVGSGPRGLTAEQVAERVRDGRDNRTDRGPTRTVGDIVRANVFTRFNWLLGALLVVALLVAPIQDGLFGIVMVVNAAIGIVQEVRAKRTLEELALLSAPKARVVRDGEVSDVAVEEVVEDDVVQLAPGDQIVVDGPVLAADGLEVDESLLTGESDPVAKESGDTCRSGSFVVAGRGTQWAQKVGEQAYATQLASQAREFTMVESELRSGIDWLLRAVSWLLVPAMVLVFWSQLTSAQGVRAALASSVAGVVGMVPQGLVLLTSMAFAVAVLRLGRRRVVVQELPAVEGLARVDTICLDKTGTLTAGHLTLHEVTALPDGEPLDLEAVLGAVAAADPTPNATLQAIGVACPPPDRDDWPVEGTLPFSSARKFSAVTFVGQGTYLLGAPEVLLDPDDEVLERAEEAATRGLRVLVLAATSAAADPDRPPQEVRPLALVVLGDDLRPDAPETIRYFVEQGVTPKIISGDHPRTVAAIAARAGVPDADRCLDARTLGDDDEALAKALDAHAVFGRVTPEQKHRMVAALQDAGHVVAMTGDGVNDVLALKQADLGIAMGAGSGATRAVAQLVLLDNDFTTMPDIVAEGRRVIANIERVANLFITKTAYAFLLALAVGVAGMAFPFLPRHLTLVGSLTIGIPGFLLAMEPTARRYRPGFLSRVLKFALPTGTVAAAATFAAYWLARDEATTLTESRTIATLTLGAIGVFALVMISRPLTPARRTMLAAVVGAFALLFALPAGREFFALDLPRVVVVLAAIGIIAITGALIFAALRVGGWLVTVDFAEVTGTAVAESGKAVRHAWTWVADHRPRVGGSGRDRRGDDGDG